jgi:hypothetical protein
MQHSEIPSSRTREWSEAESLLATGPIEGLAALDRIAAELLEENGYDVNTDREDMSVMAHVDDPELLLSFIEARALTQAVTDLVATGRSTGLETIEVAREAYRAVYDSLGG